MWFVYYWHSQWRASTLDKQHFIGLYPPDLPDLSPFLLGCYVPLFQCPLLLGAKQVADCTVVVLGAGSVQ